MAVYADIIFLRELLFDGVILLLTGWVRGVKPKAWRLLLAAGIGALYMVAMLFPDLAAMYHFFIKLFISALMIVICYGYYSLQTYLRDLISLYIISFVLAGGLMGIYYMLMSNSKQAWANFIFISGDVATKWQMGSFYIIVCSLILIYLWMQFIRSKNKRELMAQHLSAVQFQLGGQVIHCQGLIDTGNQLYDPLTRTPVMIVQVSELAHLLPAVFIECLKQGETNKALLLVTDHPEMQQWEDRIRIVPYRGVNRNSQFMVAIKPDFVVVTHEENVFRSEKVLIGFDCGQLSSDGTYQAIVHPSLVV